MEIAVVVVPWVLSVKCEKKDIYIPDDQRARNEHRLEMQRMQQCWDKEKTNFRSILLLVGGGSGHIEYCSYP